MSNITLLSESQCKALRASRPYRGRFPWADRRVGQGFAVPKDGYKKDSRPSVPEGLRKMGIRYSVTTALVDEVESFIAVRIA